jgi:arsenite oxidase small subunit
MGNEESRFFTPDELKKFDGKNGQPLYLLFKDTVYDLSDSRLWTHGIHMSVHTRNENLSETIQNAPHGEETLTRFPIIGKLREAPQSTPPQERPTEVAAEEPTKPLLERREFLKLAAAAGGALTLAAVASSLKVISFVPPSTVQQAWPKIKVINVNSLQLLVPVNFNYPLTNTPNILVKLGVKALNGVGPDGDIIAYSDVCQHLGCFYAFLAPGTSPLCDSSYKASDAQGYCCCHGSQYDLVNGAKVLGGPAPRPVPPVVLEYDATTGDIYAIAMGPPTIFGHGPAGTTDPALVLQYDLQGGDLVT